jgi:alpha-beta hydrolase superfamily lysophospholipase
MTTLRTQDGRDLNLYHWPARGVPEVMTLGIIHGYGEHAGRYAHVADALNARGISVVSADLRGHGRSSGGRGFVERFDEYHLDAQQILDAAKARAGGRPVALLGHSMGGLVLTHWMLAGGASGTVGTVLSSPYLGLALAVNPVKIALGRVMSRIVPTLGLPSGLKGADVTRDPALAAVYDSDPLNNKNATARWFTEATRAQQQVLARAGELKGPMLLMYGGADRVASADATDRFAASLRGADITSERLAGHFHELVNEPPEVRSRVLERISAWLLERAKAAA